jgi:hypothetical protein
MTCAPIMPTLPVPPIRAGLDRILAATAVEA